MGHPRSRKGMGVACPNRMKNNPWKTFLGSDLGDAEQWNDYVGTLDWGAGNRDQAAHKAFLRAGADADLIHSRPLKRSPREFNPLAAPSTLTSFKAN